MSIVYELGSKNLGVNTGGAPDTKYGLSLYSGAATNPVYGIMFTGTAGSGTHGAVNADWATYFTMNSTAGRGWIFRDNSTPTNVASISNQGHASFNGRIINPSIWINDGASTGSWNENIRLYDTSQGVSTIAFGAAAGSTSGTPRHSFVSYSDNLSFYYGGSLQEYKYNGYSLHTGSYRAPVFYDSGNTGFYVDPAGISNLSYIMLNGAAAPNLSSSAYFNAAFEVRESAFNGAGTDNYIQAPRLGFHWSGRVASQIGLQSSGRIAILNNPASDYEDFAARDILGNASMRSPIYYDSADTSYYVDPNGTSNVYAIGVGGTTVIDVNRNLTNIGTISSGAITSSGDIYTTELLRGGIGARTTSGTTDWNHLTNARSGQGYTLLLGTHTNGFGESNYYHPFSFEYSSKDGSGNMTQLAIPYLGGNIWLRSRYSGDWDSWGRINDSRSNWYMGSSVILDTSRNLTNIGTISSGAITSTGILTLSADTADTLNFSASSSNTLRGISFQNWSALTASTDGYLRLNGNSEFSNGVYTPANFRADGSVRGASYTVGATEVIDSSRNITAGAISSGAIAASGDITTQGWVQHTGVLYSRNNLLVLNTAGNGWNTWATRSSGIFNLNVGTIFSEAITSTGNIFTTGSAITVDPASGDAELRLQGAAGAQTLRLDQNSIRTSTNSPITFLTNSTSALKLNTDQSVDVTTGVFKVGGTTVIDSSRNHFGAQATFSGKVVMGGDGAIALIANSVAADTSNTYTLAVGSQGSNKSILAARDINTSGGGYQINGTTVIDSSRNLTNINALTTTGATSTFNSGRIALRADGIEDHATIGDGGFIQVNYYGYQNGHSYYRNFDVYNGKGGLSLWVNGAGNYTDISGSTRSPLFYDYNDTNYWLNPAGDGTEAGRFNGNIEIFPKSQTWAEGIAFNMPTQGVWGGLRWVRSYSAPYTGNWALGYLGSESTNDMAWWSGDSSVKWRLDHSGNATASGSSRAPIFYDSNDTGHYVDPNNTGTSVNVAGSIIAGGNITAYSDRRVKENIEPITSALNKVQQLNGVTFNRIDLSDKTKRYAGLIAQDIEKVLPEAVDDDVIKRVDYNATIGLLVEAIKELKTEVDSLKTQLAQKEH